MVDIEKVKSEIMKSLKPLNPEKVILFGSYAYGNPNDNSDIDLYVVTEDEYMPKDFKEKSQVYLKVSNALQGLLDEHPTDLITHTKAMHQKFVQMDSMFSRKILNDGVSLI